MNSSPTLAYSVGTSATGQSSSTAPASAGTYTVVATFPGSTDYQPVASAPATFTISPASSQTTLTISLPSVVFGQPVTLTANVSSAVGVVGGTVSFRDAGVQFGTAVLVAGQAQLVTSSLPTGAQNLTAVYVGSVNFVTSTSGVVTEQVNQDSTTTSLGSSANPAVLGQAVTFTATVAASTPAPAFQPAVSRSRMARR